MTPADKPDLPPAWGSAINDAGDGHIDLYSTEQVLQLLADERRTQQAALETIVHAAEKLARADERRKALSEAIVALEAEIKWQNRYELDEEALLMSIRDLIDRKEPT